MPPRKRYALSIPVFLLTLGLLLPGRFAAPCLGAVGQDLYQEGQKAFDGGDFPRAYSIFTELLGERPGDPELDFYLGRSAYETRDYETALFAFERVLIARPDQDRSRLELARTYYQVGDMESSKQYFQQVLDKNPPLGVRKNIEKFMSLIEEARKKHVFGGMASLSLVRDDNVRAAPVDETVNTLLGTTTLSGSSASPQTDLITQAALLLNHGYRFEAPGASWQTSAYTHNAFYAEEKDLDVNLLAFSTGPAWQQGPWSASLAGEFNYLMLDAERYLSTTGARAALSYALSPEFSLNSSLQGARWNFDTDARDGHQLRLDFRPVWKRGKYQIEGGASVERVEAREDEQSYSREAFSLRYQRQLPLDCSGWLEYRFQNSVYDQAPVLFGVRRHDQLSEYALGLSRQLWVCPQGGCRVVGQISHKFSDARSNIELYEYDKQVTSLGLTLLF